ncbi:MAG: polyprenyl synthetase family protein [Desulfobacterales bacterium]|nr:polyprenyl synthetase family protein [Desulfobacterales bacterium]
MFDLSAYMTEKRSRIDHHLTERLENSPAPTLLTRAMTYSLMAGGKRIRPILCLASAEAVGRGDTGILTAACAIEMIHTYSLIHDDLPAMDDDALRRGKPTCHTAFDEATAILAGDALLTLAFEVLAHTAQSAGIAPDRWLRVIGGVARAAGRSGMIEGQMQDMAAEGNPLDLDRLERMHALKTGALIEVSVFTGALLAGADEWQTDRLGRYARNIGLAFQVCDDLLNVYGDSEQMGKATGTDHERGKATYPALMGLGPSRRLAEDLVHESLKAIEEFDNRSDPLRAIARYTIDRTR